MTSQLVRSGDNYAGREWVGITTTVPIEVIFAGGCKPLDLNNVFVTNEEAYRLVEEAERSGFPRNTCCWIKGIYSVVKRLGINRVVAVTQGDCSNTHALVEMLEVLGVEVIPFGYPFRRDEELLTIELNRFLDHFGVAPRDAEEVKAELDKTRLLAREIDDLTWREGKVSGAENSLWLVSCSDMMGDYSLYQSEASRFLSEAQGRESALSDVHIRIGIVGVPPICRGLHDFIEKLGPVKIVFNEMQRQFSMPYRTSTLLEQYSRYTYPYDVFHRLNDIRAEVAKRGVDGVVHYVQSFCFRQIQDVIMRSRLDVPILTLELDRPSDLDGATRTRIEAFVEMLRERKEACEGLTPSRA